MSSFDMRGWLGRLRIPPADLSKATPPRKRASVTFAATLEFDRVERAYPRAHAVRNVSLRIEAGEIVCLLGPSGCGKTTLLRLASGIDQPTGGRVLLNERVVSGPNAHVPPESRNVGLMFQDFALFPHLSILENVAFGLKGLRRSEAAREAFAVLTRVGLGQYANEFPYVLSGGQQQRVALARAIVPRPSVILMDEPFSGLDVQLRETMRTETLALLKETRSTCMIVTHDPGEAMQLGDRIAVMRDGRIVQAGRAEELYHKPVSLFIQRLFSEINELPGIVTPAGLETPFGTFPAPGMAVGDRAVLCVRRRAVWLAKPGEDGIPGRVLAARFRGDLIQLSIGVTGLDLPLVSLVRETGAPAVGDEIRIRVDPSGTLVFPAENKE